jgi:hypothetical protein
LSFAVQEFKYGSGEGSLRAQLENIQKQHGIVPKELENLLQIPEGLYDIWSIFISLHNSRGSNGYSLNPISYTDILSYYTLYQLEPSKWEIETIRRLDGVALEEAANQSKREQQRSKSK